jgi:hypothetical protein
MEKFNLERALKGEKVITRAGNKFIISGYNPKAYQTYRLCGWVEDRTGDNGRFYMEDGTYTMLFESEFDLFMDTEGYANIHKDEHGEWLDEKIYDSEKEATDFGNVSLTYYKTIKIEK